MALMRVNNVDLKRKYERAMSRTGNHVTKAAMMVGHSRVTFLKYLRAFGMWPKKGTSRKEIWSFKKAA
jgi:DNA-binding protein Fis